MSARGRRGPIGLCLVTDRTAAGGRPPGAIALAAVSGGVDLIQVREKDLPGRELLHLVREIVDGLRAARVRARVVVNDRLDVALVAKAAGVHLPSEGLPTRGVRERSSRKLLIGRSVHSLAETRQAEKEGADYVFFGPIFETPSKAAFGPPQGVAALRRVVSSVKLPVWAIGGINCATAGELAGIPLAGIAAISAFTGAADPAAAARSLREALGAPMRP